MTGATDGVLRVSGVTRAFGPRTVLEDVGFDVRPGVLTGFIGANGAGKTTTMRILLGLLEADRGTVTWHGRPLDREARRRFGYMPEERGLYPKMPVLDQIVFFGRLYGLDAARARERAEGYLERLGLGDRMHDRLQTLSLGNQQRVQVAAALVHHPALFILDEPFSGLDPVAVDTMATLLREQAAHDAPVLFSSHQLDLVEQLCDDIVIIHEGRVRAAGPAEELRLSRAGSRFALTLRPGADGEPVDGAWLATEPFVRSVTAPAAGEFVVDLASLDDDQRLLRAALDRYPVRRFERVVPTLAEIFRETAA